MRPPPLHPEAFAAKLARKVFTNGKSDLEMVAGIYARTLDGAFGGAETLTFMNCGWGEEVKALAKVLPLARARRFSISTQPQDPDGWRALAEAIAAGGAPRLKDLSVRLRDYTAVWPTSDGGALKRACEAHGIVPEGADHYSRVNEICRSSKKSARCAPIAAWGAVMVTFIQLIPYTPPRNQPAPYTLSVIQHTQYTIDPYYTSSFFYFRAHPSIRPPLLPPPPL